MRSLFLALCLISLGFLPLIHGQQLSVTGLGGFTMARVVSGWSFAYQLLRPEVPDCRKISDSSSQLSVSWAGSTSSAAITGVQSGALDFGGIVTVLNSAQRAFVRDLLISGYSHAQGIRQYPITTSQVSVLYNLPLSYLPTDALNLTRAAVCGIFTGQVTQWDDPVILNANPAINPLDVSGKNITVIVRADSNGGTLVFTQLVYALNCSNWSTFYSTGTTFSIFPSYFLALPQVKSYTTAIGVAGGVLSTPYSFSYDELGYAIDNSISVANLQNLNDEFASPYSTTGSATAINNIVLDNTTNAAPVANLAGAGVYPFLTLGYLILDTTFNTSTEQKQREVLKMIRWGLTDATADQIAVLGGFITLPTRIRDQVLDQLSLLEYQGVQLLRIVALPQHHSAAFKVLLAFSVVLWVISLAAIGSAWYIGSRSKNPLFYAICLGVGTSLAYCSLIFFYLVPDRTWVCQLRLWFLAPGLTLLFGVMFARGWQLHTLHVQRDSVAVPSKKDIVSTMSLIIIVGVLLSVQLALLVIWSAVDLFKSRRVYPNTIDLESRYICGSKHTIVWLILELCYFLGLLGWGLFVVYRTWRSRAAVDSRWTLIAVYNTLMTIVIIIPLLSTVAKSDDWVFFLAVLGTDFAIMSAVGSIYGSVLLRRLWDQVSGGSSGSGSGKEKVSTFRTSMSGEGTVA